ncbi:bidirectional sugar transporter sweet15 [Phtheirospermum japonicum]|uniref:Bidirectional sugar transporter sweet15 n=1 Tax=Phtheirospermum japonicum TaxID=374723 RepID=A0A830CBU4_9LAMI|nr:bidirectional sugar transporter sweet15 [Phtheirospermum japonicum]
MWLYYGWLKLINAIIITNALGAVIEVLYIGTYLYYAQTSDRIFATKLLGVFIGLFFVIISVTLPIFQGGIIITVVGWLCICATVMAFAAPMFNVYQVVQTRSVKYMPITLSCTLTLSGGVWCIYGLLTSDLLVAVNEPY